MSQRISVCLSVAGSSAFRLRHCCPVSGPTRNRTCPHRPPNTDRSRLLCVLAIPTSNSQSRPRTTATPHPQSNLPPPRPPDQKTRSDSAAFLSTPHSSPTSSPKSNPNPKSNLAQVEPEPEVEPPPAPPSPFCDAEVEAAVALSPSPRLPYPERQEVCRTTVAQWSHSLHSVLCHMYIQAATQINAIYRIPTSTPWSTPLRPTPALDIASPRSALERARKALRHPRPNPNPAPGPTHHAHRQRTRTLPLDTAPSSKPNPNPNPNHFGGPRGTYWEKHQDLQMNLRVQINTSKQCYRVLQQS